MDVVLTTCPFCSCGCGLFLHSSDGRVDGTAASERHPVAGGRLCARGWAAHEAPSWGERLDTPLLRRNGVLRPASWDEVLAAATAGLASATRAGGVVGVLGSARATNEENYLGARLARGALAVPHVDTCLGPAYRGVLAGLEEATGCYGSRGTIEEVAGSEVIILLDGDVAASHPQVAAAVMRAVKRGARLVTLSVAETKLARLAAISVRVAPGREREATVALVAAAVAAGRFDTGVVAGSPNRLEALRESVGGLAADEGLRRAAAWYALARRAAIVVAPLAGEGVGLRQLGADLGTLAALTGHLGREGSPLLVLPVRGNQRGACEAGASPDLLPGCAALDDAEAAGRVAEAWGGVPCRERGLDATEMVAAARGLVVVAEDLTAALPAGTQALAAAAAGSFLVVLEAFVTPTTAAATVVLPIAAFAENEGTVTNLEGRVQRVRPAVYPPGQARPGWAVLAEICRRLGAAAGYGSVDDVRRELGRVVPAYAALREVELDLGWGAMLTPPRSPRGLPPDGVARATVAPRAPLVAAVEEAFDWGATRTCATPRRCAGRPSRGGGSTRAAWWRWARTSWGGSACGRGGR